MVPCCLVVLLCCALLVFYFLFFFFFFSSRRRHTRFDCDWSSDVCSSDLPCLRCLGAGGIRALSDVWGGGRPVPGADADESDAVGCRDTAPSSAEGDRKSVV